MCALKNGIGTTFSLIACTIVALMSLEFVGSAPILIQQPSIPPPAPMPSGPTVLPDGYVKFMLNAPQATEVILNLQNSIGPSPAADPVAMRKDAAGVWSATVGPLKPDWYGYGFILDGVKIADPQNRDIWSGATSTWSYVLVPGTEANFFADASVPHGAWGTVRYFSKVANKERQMQVYTPPGYGRDNLRYPVLYLMHGGGGNDTDWIVNMRANYIMDNLIAQKKVKPMMMVMPDGYVTPPTVLEGVTDPFPEELLGSIVPTIEQNYRVQAGGTNRALAGLSLGGRWTMDTLILHPGAFAYIGTFSARWASATREDLVNNHSSLLTNPELNKNTKLFWITIGGPEDTGRPGALDDMLATRALFDRHKINYKFVQGTGGHTWEVWRRNLRDFAQFLFQ